MKAGIGCNPTMNKDTAKISNLFCKSCVKSHFKLSFDLILQQRLYSLFLIQMETLTAIVPLPKYFVENDPPTDCIIQIKTDIDM